MLVVAVPAAARSGSPRALYKALLTSPVPKSQLPKGFGAPRISRFTPDAVDRRHRIVGEVELEFTGRRAAIFYLVFPTRADARGDLHDGVSKIKGVRSRRPAPALPQPAVILSGVEHGGAFAEVLFVTRNVLVAAIVALPRSPRAGQADALVLARLALRHLDAVERRL